MNLTPLEQETIILYNQAEGTADIYTHDPKLMKKLEHLSEQDPDIFIRKDDHNFLAPKKCVSVRALYGEARRQAAKDRAIAGGFRPPVRRKE